MLTGNESEKRSPTHSCMKGVSFFMTGRWNRCPGLFVPCVRSVCGSKSARGTNNPVTCSTVHNATGAERNASHRGCVALPCEAPSPGCANRIGRFGRFSKVVRIGIESSEYRSRPPDITPSKLPGQEVANNHPGGTMRTTLNLGAHYLGKLSEIAFPWRPFVSADVSGRYATPDFPLSQPYRHICRVFGRLTIESLSYRRSFFGKSLCTMLVS